jgi:16S rRNA (cytosine967-C5)-methyltransferase
MMPSARIQAVIEMVDAVIETPKPADGVVSQYLRHRRYIGAKDRAALNIRLYRVLRHYYRYGWWIEKAGLKLSGRLLVMTDILFQGEATVQSIHQLFSGDKFAAEALSKQEIIFVERLSKEKSFNHKDMSFTVRYECPEWAYEAMLKTMSEAEMIKELEAMNKPATLDVRVNELIATRDEVFERFKADGIDCALGDLSPWAIRIYERPNLSQHPLFLNGAVEVQDEGSQLVALVANPKPGQQVVDFCAGAGGKTLAMASMMRNKGRIVAMDVLDRRLERAKVRFRRAGAHNIETHAIAGDHDKWLKRRAEHFDIVLVDAPCTGVGTWRRDPDKRFKQLGPDLVALCALQAEILARASKLVKKGGALIYATCSLLPAENQLQIDDFLKSHPHFKKVEFSLNGQRYHDLIITPAQHGTDGFYATRLERLA